MNKLKLNEVLSSDMKYESVEKSNRQGVLRTIKGNITDYISNRNGRVYGKSLWEKALSSDLVQEQVECNSFFGEANHPFDDRMEIDISKISHAVRDIEIGNDSVTAKIDILDTPMGNIINSLVEYGAKIGISSRGCGSLDESTNEVCDDYQLFCFDLVARPSVASARLTESQKLVQEGKVMLTETEIASVVNSYRDSLPNTGIVGRLINESIEINKKI